MNDHGGSGQIRRRGHCEPYPSGVEVSESGPRAEEQRNVWWVTWRRYDSVRRRNDRSNRFLERLNVVELTPPPLSHQSSRNVKLDEIAPFDQPSALERTYDGVFLDKLRQFTCRENPNGQNEKNYANCPMGQRESSDCEFR